MMIDTQLDWIRALHTLRSPALDMFFRGWNFFDTGYFYMLALPLVWALAGWKWSIRISYLVILNALVNVVLKDAFSLPRPYYLDQNLAVIDGIKGYGFPSGAAQSAMIILLLSTRLWKHKWVMHSSYIFFFFLSFSRIYLGVHFFSDIFIGWIVGACVYLVYEVAYSNTAMLLRKSGNLTRWICIVGVPLLLYLLQWEPRMLRLAPLLLGLSLACLSSFRLRHQLEFFKQKSAQWGSYFFVVLGIAILILLESSYPEWGKLITPLQVYWNSFLGFYLYKIVFGFLHRRSFS